MSVEIIRPHLSSKHDIIIEVDELFRETWYLMKVTLNGRRAVGRKMRVILEDLLQERADEQGSQNKVTMYFIEYEPCE